MEFQLSFSDHTILEADGVYEDVKDIMDRESYKDCDWAIKSGLTIESSLGFCDMSLDFYSDGKIVITEYQTTSEDVYYNPDIQCISCWAQQNGWLVPQPHPDLIRENRDFWIHFWEARLVDSEYLEKAVGKRDSISLDVDQDDGDWE